MELMFKSEKSKTRVLINIIIKSLLFGFLLTIIAGYLFGYRAFIVNGYSAEPAIHYESLAVIYKGVNDIKVGDYITRTVDDVNNYYVTHKVTEIHVDENGYTYFNTRASGADHNDGQDSSTNRNTMRTYFDKNEMKLAKANDDSYSYNYVVGKVMFSIDNVGTVLKFVKNNVIYVAFFAGVLILTPYLLGFVFKQD